jgi:cholesterol transport system auxiliary component
MNKFTVLGFVCFGFLLQACSPVKTPIYNHYKLESYSAKHYVQRHSKQSILVTAPEAAAGYACADMLYVKKPFELSAFVNNSWIDQPANMLLPLITQSLERSGYFFAVTSGAYSEKTDYRLDTELIKLQQNFLKQPSQIDFVAKVVLTHVSENRIVASRLITEQARCPMETPFGGVLGANQATTAFTAAVTDFVITQIKRDLHQT